MLGLESLVLLAPSHPLVAAKNVSRLCQGFPGGPMCPQWRTTGLVAMASDSTAERIFPSSQSILLDSLVYRSSSCWHLYNENCLPTECGDEFPIYEPY